MKAKNPLTRFVQIPETDDGLASHFLIACQVKEYCERRLAAPVELIINHLKKCPGRMDHINGFEIRLVKRNTLRKRGMLYRDFIRALPMEREWKQGGEIGKAVSQWILHQQRLDAAQASIDVLGEIISKRMRRRGKKRMVMAGVEFWLVKRNTLRCRIVGHNEHSKYWKPFRDD